MPQDIKIICPITGKPTNLPRQDAGWDVEDQQPVDGDDAPDAPGFATISITLRAKRTEEDLKQAEVTARKQIQADNAANGRKMEKAEEYKAVATVMDGVRSGDAPEEVIEALGLPPMDYLRRATLRHVSAEGMARISAALRKEGVLAAGLEIPL